MVPRTRDDKEDGPYTRRPLPVSGRVNRVGVSTEGVGGCRRLLRGGEETTGILNGV